MARKKASSAEQDPREDDEALRAPVGEAVHGSPDAVHGSEDAKHGSDDAQHG